MKFRGRKELEIVMPAAPTPRGAEVAVEVVVLAESDLADANREEGSDDAGLRSFLLLCENNSISPASNSKKSMN